MHHETTERVTPRKVKKAREPLSIMSIGLGIAVVLFLATMAASPLVMTSRSSERNVMVQPFSHSALRFDVFGVGIFEFSIDVPGSIPSGVAMLEMTEGNYKSYQSQGNYDTLRYALLNPGGSVDSSEMGTMWVRYLVIENDSPMTVTLTVGYSSVPIFSLVVAVPLFAFGLLVLAIMAHDRK
jgi:hypothetical protein